jgi:hypothetical protein
MKFLCAKNLILMRLRIIFFIFFLVEGIQLSHCQEPIDTLKTSKTIEELTYQQQPGLALAASKIFFSKKRYSISGFGEINAVGYLGPKNTQAGDLELYYSNLYRFATFFGYRITNKIIWNSEFQIEFLHDGIKETHHELVFEAFADFLIHDNFKARVGFFPLTIGYVNNNDEPIMFYSVNRSEVERLIIPSTWVEFGTMFYGKIASNLSYTLGFSQGLNAQRYIGGTWVRQGREIRFNVPNNIAVNPQLNYIKKNLTLSASGYFGYSGQGQELFIDNQKHKVLAPISLLSSYIKYDWKNIRFVSVGTLGKLGETDKIFHLTKENGNDGQVVGSNVYGFLAEIGIDILPYFRKNKEIEDKKSFFVHKKEMKAPVFIRYERLNTHAHVHQNLVNYSRDQRDLDILTIGINFNTRENFVLKANYQFRNNRYKNVLIPESDIIELGIGFVF